MIDRCHRSKYFNTVVHKLCLVRLKCHSETHITYESHRFSMFALNYTITSVLASKVMVKVCYILSWSVPSVSSGNKNKKKSELH